MARPQRLYPVKVVVVLLSLDRKVSVSEGNILHNYTKSFSILDNDNHTSIDNKNNNSILCVPDYQDSSTVKYRTGPVFYMKVLSKNNFSNNRNKRPASERDSCQPKRQSRARSQAQTCA